MKSSKVAVLIVFTLFVISYSQISEKVLELVKLSKGQVSIIGHRGMAGIYPEHSLIGFDEAYKSEVDFLEIDVNITKDNVLVVAHDEYLDEFTDVSDHPEFDKYRATYKVVNLLHKNKVFIKDLTFNQLKKIKLTQRISSRPKQYDHQYSILSLEYFLEHFIAKNKKYNRTTGLYLEPKSPSFYSEYGYDMKAMIKQILLKYKLDNSDDFEEYSKFPIVFQCFDKEFLEQISYKNKDFKIPTVGLNRWVEFNDFSKQASFVNGISVDIDFIIYDRIDDEHSLDGVVYSSKEDFINQVVQKHPNWNLEKKKSKVMNENINAVIKYFDNLSMPVVLFTMNNDFHSFNENPFIEYTKMRNLGISGFFTNFCLTAEEALRND